MAEASAVRPDTRKKTVFDNEDFDMAQTTQTKTENTQDMFENANNSFRSAIDAGMKFQRDTFDMMTKAFNFGGFNFGDVNERVEENTTEAVNMVRKNAEQTQKAFDESCKNGLGMIRKNFDMMKNEDKDMVARATDMWTAGFDALKSNVDTTAKTATQVMETYSEFVNKSATNMTKKAGK